MINKVKTKKHASFESLFSEAVKAKRKSRDMTQSDLAYICGVHRATIAGIENGLNMPTFSGGVFMARVLGIDLNKLPLVNDVEGE